MKTYSVPLTNPKIAPANSVRTEPGDERHRCTDVPRHVDERPPPAQAINPPCELLQRSTKLAPHPHQGGDGDDAEEDPADRDPVGGLRLGCHVMT